MLNACKRPFKNFKGLLKRIQKVLERPFQGLKKHSPYLNLNFLRGMEVMRELRAPTTFSWHLSATSEKNVEESVGLRLHT